MIGTKLVELATAPKQIPRIESRKLKDWYTHGKIVLPSQSRQDTIIGTRENFAFSIYMDDHVGAAKSFDAMFEFLHTKYFPRVAFGPVYLAGKKTRIFDDHLHILGYEGGNGALRPSTKHRQQVADWPILTNRAELDAFLWLTPFLRIFIPGRAAHVMKLK